MTELENKIAKLLLQIKAIKLEPTNPFSWASGWKSPIYCDNRKSLSYPDVRNTIKSEFAKIIKEKFSDTEIIAGVATGAIAHGVLVADELDLPFIYVRSGSKKHGLRNLIEGQFEKGNKVIIIEDLVSTGGSSLAALEALRDAGCIVSDMLSIFTYGFSLAESNFKKSNCKLFSLTNYNAIIRIAIESGYITENDISSLEKWRQDPSSWNR